MLSKKHVLVAVFPLFIAAESQAENWYIKPFLATSGMSDQTVTADAVGALNGNTDVDLDQGFAAGFGIGYRYESNWSVEFAWEYRSNDSQVTLPDGSQFNDGNYASNLFAVNGYYHFGGAQNKWTPYIGGGLVWSQEIDIDLEQNGIEQSYTADGDAGFQVMGGVEYAWDDNWSIGGELRFTRLSGIDLSGEGAPGSLDDFDYDPWSAQVHLVYRF